MRKLGMRSFFEREMPERPWPHAELVEARRTDLQRLQNAGGSSFLKRDREGVMKRMAFCSLVSGAIMALAAAAPARAGSPTGLNVPIDRKSTRLNSSHV